jgi:hypothetical protein
MFHGDVAGAVDYNVASALNPYSRADFATADAHFSADLERHPSGN